MAEKNYHSMKDEELGELMTKYGIDPIEYKNENGSVNRKKLIGVLKIVEMAVGKATETLVMNDKGEVSTHQPTKKLHNSLSGMMVQITFFNHEEQDLPYVQLGLNGIALHIPREEEVWIPKEFIDGVLLNAVTTKLKMDVDRDGKIRYIPKQVPRMSYTVKDIKHIDVLRKEFDEAKNKKS